MKILNLGCGKSTIKGFVNVDSHKLKGVDIVHDLNKFPYPFKTKTFHIILAEHIIEHLDDIPKVMEELYRILKPSGIVEIISPHFASMSAFIDPTHKHYFSVSSFDYFTNPKDFDYYSKCRFKIIRKRVTFPEHYKFLEPIISRLMNKFKGFYETNLCYLIRPKFIEITLRRCE